MIVESRKLEKRRVQQVILKYVGIASSASELESLNRLAVVELEKLREERAGKLLFDSTDVLLEQADYLANFEKLKIQDLEVEATTCEGPELVYGKLFDDLGFTELLDDRAADVLRSVVSQRTVEPESKLALAERISKEQVNKLSEDRIYRMMDKLSEKTDEIRTLVRKNAERHQGGQIDVVFYDCTTLYFESTCDDSLRKFGFSKDHKFHQTQVVLAVATTGRGLPVDFQLFPGNTAESTTLIACLERWKSTFPIGTVTFVADRGLFSIKNIIEIEQAGYHFIVACPLRKTEKQLQQKILDHFSMNQNTDSEAKERLKPLQESVTFRVKDREPTTGEKTEKTITGTLTVEYSASRAKKDQADRDKLIKKMRSKVGLGPTNPKNLISNQGYKKFIAVTETGTIKLNEEKIKADGLWDGLHGIFSNLNLSPEEIRARYKHLWTIEETFRISKHDLEIRPMYHWKPKRILAHISICYISLAIARHIELTLKNEGISMSVRRIAQAISSIQACTIRDKRTGNRFKFPVQLNSDSRAVLQALRIPYRSGAVSI